MKILYNNIWVDWKSTQDAWDEKSLAHMSDKEKLITLGKPVYALYQNGFPVDYAASYYMECQSLYPQSMIDRSMKYYERKFYSGLTKVYNEMVAERERDFQEFMKS